VGEKKVAWAKAAKRAQRLVRWHLYGLALVSDNSSTQYFGAKTALGEGQYFEHDIAECKNLDYGL